MPTGSGPHPAAVIIHGSGTSDRDNLWYLQIVHDLAKNGIAVFLPDKRGAGKSEGAWRTSSFEDFAKDTVAGLERVRAEATIDAEHVGLIGISQGGRIAPLAATIAEDLVFLVNLSGSTVTPEESLRHESIETLVQQGVPRPIARFTEPIVSAVPMRRRAVWWKKNRDFDPIVYWQQVTVPALIVYGEEDEQDNVPVARSVRRLEPLVGNPANGELTIQIVEDAGHGFLISGSRQIRPEVLKLLQEWITDVVN